MAHIKMTPERKACPFIYNVDMAVGAMKTKATKQSPENGGPMDYISSKPQANKPDDVMLVQYLLKRIYQAGDMTNPQLNGGKADPAGLKIDGYWGPKTQSAIEHFQIEMRRNGKNIATDGCVDSEKSGPVSSISKTGYTITWLNKYFWILYPSLAANITIDYECPPELKQKIATAGV